MFIPLFSRLWYLLRYDSRCDISIPQGILSDFLPYDMIIPTIEQGCHLEASRKFSATFVSFGHHN